MPQASQLVQNSLSVTLAKQLMIKNIFFVALGGASGSVLRYLVSHFTARVYNGHFPVATFLINITGCFLIGIAMGALGNDHQSQSLKLLAVTGFCGGYTTFSAFAYENLMLLNSNNLGVAVGYIFASIIFGIAAVWLGLKLM